MSSPYICGNCQYRLATTSRGLTRRVHPKALQQANSLVVNGQRALHTTKLIKAVQSEARRPSQFKSNASSSPSASRAVSEEVPKTADMQRVLRERAANTKQFNPILRLAQLLRKRASTATETYAAYGACEQLVKECSRQADYTIAKAERNADLPKTKAGEDLGQGDGWWYSREFCDPFGERI